MPGLLSLLKRIKPRKTKQRSQPAAHRHRARLGMETLEDRFVPASITELPALPTLSSTPYAITKAYDGSMWFTERGANKLGRISTTGVLTEYAIPTANSAPEAIAASPDGYVWFTERYGKKIGRINQAGGAISEFTVPGYGAYPTAITYVAATNKVWFASVESSSVARLGRISATGTFTMLPSANTAAVITSLVGDASGNLWVTRVSSRWGDSISKVNTTGNGSWTHYKLPTAGSSPQSITLGSDGNYWFTERNSNRIGKITTTGVITEYQLATGSGPQTIVSGPNGNLYFTMKSSNKVGQITTAGVVTEYVIPTANSQPHGMAVGYDGNLWFTESSSAGNRLAKLVL
jgi:streptogramin lyase